MATPNIALRMIDKLAQAVEFALGLLGSLCLVAALLRAQSSPEPNTLSTILYGIGTSLLATAAAIFVASTAQARTALRLHGLQRIYRRRAEVDEDEYRNLIASAKRRVWVQGIGLGRFISRNELVLENAASRGVDVRLLVLAPDPTVHMASGTDVSFLSLRALEESRRPLPATGAERVFSKDHESLLAFLVRARLHITTSGGTAASLQARQYFCSSATMVFLIDDGLFVGPYLHLADSGEMPTFYFGRGAVLDEVERHFRDLWDDDRFTTPLPVTAS